MPFFRQILEKTAIFVKKTHLKQQSDLLYLYLQDGIFFEKQYRGVALLRQRHAVKPVHLRRGVKEYLAIPIEHGRSHARPAFLNNF